MTSLALCTGVHHAWVYMDATKSRSDIPKNDCPVAWIGLNASSPLLFLLALVTSLWSSSDVSLVWCMWLIDVYVCIMLMHWLGKCTCSVYRPVVQKTKMELHSESDQTLTLLDLQHWRLYIHLQWSSSTASHSRGTILVCLMIVYICILVYSCMLPKHWKDASQLASVCVKCLTCRRYVRT